MTEPSHLSVNRELARALGVTDTSDVTKITLTLSPLNLPRIEVHRVVLPKSGASMADGIATVVDALQLEPKTPT